MSKLSIENTEIVHQSQAYYKHVKLFTEGSRGERDWVNQRILSLVLGMCERLIIITFKVWHILTFLIFKCIFYQSSYIWEMLLLLKL